jgi:hypothetical protein
MCDNVLDIHGTNNAELSPSFKSKTSERPSSGFPQPNVLGREMHLPVLATQCLREIDHYRRRKPFTERYSIELFRRAIVQNDPEARLWVQYCFGGLVRSWLHCHPKLEAACRLRSEETYVSLAFERFWLRTTSKQGQPFNRLAPAFQYLRASLQGVILDILRIYARPGVVSWTELAEQRVEENLERKGVWVMLKTMLANPREQRLAYLLFQCGLAPREIMRLCPQEWRAIDEISELRLIILRRFLGLEDHLQ